MIPPIHIDTMDLSSQFDMTQQDVDHLKETVVKTLTKVVYSSWVRQAKENLGSTRQEYVTSLIVSEEGRFANRITLVGELPNDIEQGKQPFDMKPGFEDSDKKIITKNAKGALGWYLTIPFTWAQPGAIAESGKFTGVLPGDIANVLTKKQKSAPGSPLRLSDIPEQYKVPASRPAIRLLNDQVIPEYQHKSSIFEGAVKKGGLVTSFRRVSNNSDDSSWMHPGFTARNFADAALEDARVDEVVGDVIDKFLDQLI